MRQVVSGYFAYYAVPTHIWHLIRSVSGLLTPLDGSGGELYLHCLEHGGIEDRLVITAIGLAAIEDLSEVEAILQEMGYRSLDVDNFGLTVMVVATVPGGFGIASGDGPTTISDVPTTTISIVSPE